jgi:hypothetical protein
LGASCEAWSTCITTYKTTNMMMFWANGSAMRKRIIADEKKESKMNTL